MTDPKDNFTSYGYDAKGNLESRIDNTGETTFTYDLFNRLTTKAVPNGLNRLAQATTKSPAGATTADYGYLYDANGNRTQSTVNGTSSPVYGYNAANQLVSSGGAGWGSYDGAGNQTSDGTGMWFEYNAKNQTSSITPKGGSPLNLSYTDVDSTERVQAGDTSFVSGAFGIATAQAPAGNTHYTREDAGNLIGQRKPSGNYYYLFDGLGSVIGLTDAAGGVVNRYAYDPYGNTTSATEDVANPWRFAGGYLDGQTGLTKFGTRYYDPKIGRWTQQEPFAGSLADPNTINRYAYVGNDPVNFIDPSGFSRVTVIAGGAALVLGTVAFIATAPVTLTASAVAVTVAGAASLLVGAALLGYDIHTTYIRCGRGTRRRC